MTPRREKVDTFTDAHRQTLWNLIDDDRMVEAENVALDAALAEIDRLRAALEEINREITDEGANDRNALGSCIRVEIARDALLIQEALTRTPIADMVDAFAAWLRAPSDRPHTPDTPDTPHAREVREFVYCAIHRGIVPLADATRDGHDMYICRRCTGKAPR